jgi:hypothetical protein
LVTETGLFKINGWGRMIAGLDFLALRWEVLDGAKPTLKIFNLLARRAADKEVSVSAPHLRRIPQPQRKSHQ